MYRLWRIDLSLVLILICLISTMSCSPSPEELAATAAAETAAAVTKTPTNTLMLTPSLTPTDTPTLTPTLTPIPPTPPDMSGELLWFAPNFSRHLPENPDQENECWDLFLPDAPWTKAKEHVDVIQIDQPALSSYRIDDNGVVQGFPLPQTIDFTKQAGKYLSIQVIGPGNGICSGEEAAARDLAELAKIPLAGGEVNFIVIPEPIEQMISDGYDNNCGFTFEQAAEQLSLYVSSLRLQIPMAKIGIVEPLHGYSMGPLPPKRGYHYHGEFTLVFERIFNVLESHDQTIDFFHMSSINDPNLNFIHYINYYIDHPPDDSTGNYPGVALWMHRKISGAGDYFKSRNIRVGVIYLPHAGGEDSDKLFFEDTLQIKELILRDEKEYNDFILKSYLEYPSSCLPEDEPFTYTNLIINLEEFTAPATITPQPTYDNVWNVEVWCEQHVGCEKLEVKNQSDYWVNIVLKSQEFWGATKMFSIPPRGHDMITLKPGSYHYTFTYCGGEFVDYGYHNLSFSWYLEFRQEWCKQ